MQRSVVIVLGILFNLVLMQVSYGQNDEALKIVVTAYENLQALDIYQITGLRFLAYAEAGRIQSVYMGMDIGFQSMAETNTDMDDAHSVLKQHQTFDTGDEQIEMIFTFDRLLTKGELFSRIDIETAPSEFSQEFPEGWFNWEDTIGITSIGKIDEDKVYSEPTPSYSLEIWVGETDNLPHYIEYQYRNNIDYSGAVSAIQSIKGEPTYFAFNDPVLIESPKLGEQCDSKY